MLLLNKTLKSENGQWRHFLSLSKLSKYRAAPEKEWGLIYKLASDKQGFLHKDSVRGIYDGSVFYKLEEQRTSSRSDI